MAAVGFNWFLILIAVVVALLVLAVCVYIIVEYQHPEDRNQAWVPKIIVLLSMWLAITSVLMFPLDVANTRACSTGVSPSACTLTLPMYTLWQAVFISGLVLAFAIIPFTMFYYEADSDYTCGQKIKSALMMTLAFLIILGLIIGICYGLFGYVVYPTQELTSGVRDISLLQNRSVIPDFCIKPLTNSTTPSAQIPDMQCTAIGTSTMPARFVLSNWKLRVSIPIYVMAIQSVLGWVLFLIFAGVGIMAAPIDWLQQFLGRPKIVITKSEYMARARIIAQRAKEIANMIALLRRQDKDRKWRSNMTRVTREVALLEEDEYQLERIYPQGEDGDVRWVMFMLGFWVLLAMSIVGFCVSLMWIAQIIVYMVPPSPLNPLLNNMFVAMDDVFPLFGTLMFGLFSLYLMAVAMKGNFMLGLNFLVIKLYPMRPGATMMSSFLINTALILIMSPAIIQFCAQAFAVYANNTSIFDVFGNQVMFLMGVRFIYNFNIFLYIFLAVITVSSLFMAIRGRVIWKRRDPMDAYRNMG